MCTAAELLTDFCQVSREISLVVDVWALLDAGRGGAGQATW